MYNTNFIVTTKYLNDKYSDIIGNCTLFISDDTYYKYKHILLETDKGKSYQIKVRYYDYDSHVCTSDLIKALEEQIGNDIFKDPS